MSRLITVFVIIVLVLSLSITGIFYAKETKEVLSALAEEGIAYCEAENQEGLRETTKKMSAYWESKHSFLSFYVRHDEIEKIEIHLVTLEGYEKSSSLESVGVCLRQFKFMVEHIYQRELPNIDNLF